MTGYMHTSRVVIVDDTPDVRSLLKILLGRYATLAVVAEAGDGLDGVAAVVEQRPDAVILDLSMPRMDGLTALGHIKTAAPECRVIVLSAYRADHFAAQALAAGACAYVEKGAIARELIDALALALGRPLVRKEPALAGF